MAKSIINKPAYVEIVIGAQKKSFPKNGTTVEVDSQRLKMQYLNYELLIRNVSEIDSIVDDDTPVPVPATLTLLYDIIAPFFFRSLESTNPSGNFLATYRALNFTDLITNVATNPQETETAYVVNPEGTVWLPGSLGGTYYPRGLYYYNGTQWISDKQEVAEQLQINIDDIEAIELVNANQDTAIANNAAAALAARDRANHTGTQLHTTISDFDTGVRENRLNQMAIPTANINLNTNRIINLAAPVNNNDAVRLVDIYESAIQSELGLINQTVAFEPFFIRETIPNVDATGTWAFTPPEDGDYELSMFIRHSYNQTTSNFLSHVLRDGVSFDFPLHIEPKDSGGPGIVLPTVANDTLGPNANTETDQFCLASGSRIMEALPSGTPVNLRLEFAGQNTGQEATIYNAILRVKRILNRNT